MYARAVLMADGHDPRDIDEYAWRDIAAYLRVRDLLQPGPVPE